MVYGSRLKTAVGNCLSYNVIYMIQCSICNDCYIDRSTRPLRVRSGEHRRSFYKILKGEKVDLKSDEFALGKHLFNHGFKKRTDFNEIYSVCLLEVCSPKILDVKEHRFIHKLQTLAPQGINLTNPFSIPLLHR